MQKNKIALQLYSVRDDMEQDFYGTLKKVKEMGYSGVEFAGLFGHSPEEVKAMCDELDLVALSAHVPLQDLREDPDGIIATYKALGCQYIVIPYLTPEFRPGKPGFQTVIDSAKMLGEKMEKEGMVLQYHNHDFEFVKLDGQYALDILYTQVGPELLQTQLDTCWVNVGGEDPAQYLKKYAGRTPTVHLKDFNGGKSENMYALIGIDDNKKSEEVSAFELRPLGKGVQDFPAIIAAATEGGAEWFIVEQDNPSMGLSPLQCAEVSIHYLMQLP